MVLLEALPVLANIVLLLISTRIFFTFLFYLWPIDESIARFHFFFHSCNQSLNLLYQLPDLFLHEAYDRGDFCCYKKYIFYLIET